MGDEARLPPHLTGVGDKLNPEWLKTVLNEGARDRPYMLVRMPKFGQTGVGALAELISATDVHPETLDVNMPVAEHRYKADARHMIGDRALGCIKCHTFDQYKVTGVQAVNMTTMTRRLRREWFHRYLRNPSEYRPGTRMPGHGRMVDPCCQNSGRKARCADRGDVEISSGWQSGQSSVGPSEAGHRTQAGRSSTHLSQLSAGTFSPWNCRRVPGKGSLCMGCRRFCTEADLAWSIH